MKKKRIVLGIICVIAILAIVIIGFVVFNQKKNHGLSKKDPQSLTIWHYYNGAQGIEFEQLVAEFNDTVGRDMGIVVYAESKSSINDLNIALMDSAQKKVGAEEMPNLFQCYQATAMDLDQLGVLGSFDPYLSEEEKSEYVDSYMEEAKLGVGNEMKLFPFAKSTEVLMLNKTDWDAFAQETGATTDDLATWEGLAKTAEKYYNWSGGEAFFGRDAFANYMVIGAKQLGKEFFPVQDGQVSLQVDQDVCRKLWDNYYVPFVKGYYASVGRFRSDDIKLGIIVAQVCSNTSATYFPSEVAVEDGTSYPIDFMVLPVPNFEGCDPLVVQQGADMAMKKGTEREEYASTVFLKWFTQKQQNVRYALNSSYLPVKKDAIQKDVIDQFMTENEENMSGIERETMKVALKQVETSDLYASKGFLNGDQARDVLNTSMADWAMNDYAEVAERIENGEDREEVLQDYLSEEHFEAWFLDCKEHLERVLPQ